MFSAYFSCFKEKQEAY